MRIFRGPPESWKPHPYLGFYTRGTAPCWRAPGLHQLPLLPPNSLPSARWDGVSSPLESAAGCYSQLFHMCMLCPRIPAPLHSEPTHTSTASARTHTAAPGLSRPCGHTAYGGAWGWKVLENGPWPQPGCWRGGAGSTWAGGGGGGQLPRPLPLNLAPVRPPSQHALLWIPHRSCLCFAGIDPRKDRSVRSDPRVWGDAASVSPSVKQGAVRGLAGELLK